VRNHLVEIRREASDAKATSYGKKRDRGRSIRVILPLKPTVMGGGHKRTCRRQLLHPSGSVSGPLRVMTQRVWTKNLSENGIPATRGPVSDDPKTYAPIVYGLVV
jgi:hypothetical protein